MFDFLEICGKLILSLTTVLILIFLVFRVFGNKVNDINNKIYIGKTESSIEKRF